MVGWWIDVDSLLQELSDHATEASNRFFQGNVNDRDGMNRAQGEIRAFSIAIALLRDYRDANR